MPEPLCRGQILWLASQLDETPAPENHVFVVLSVPVESTRVTELLYKRVQVIADLHVVEGEAG